ncbi:unnamed protein product [Ambrosiozyma monospora]|uniref:Unnamed protein product n=1 Tax=Ambrosiozyma monospora TaxID=43982 RepID=A0ACB5T1T7_AMBMO|nr:unnamed protein product [Ambrosiozyma monospora]
MILGSTLILTVPLSLPGAQKSASSGAPQLQNPKELSVDTKLAAPESSAKPLIYQPQPQRSPIKADTLGESDYPQSSNAPGSVSIPSSNQVPQSKSIPDSQKPVSQQANGSAPHQSQQQQQPVVSQIDNELIPQPQQHTANQVNSIQPSSDTYQGQQQPQAPAQLNNTNAPANSYNSQPQQQQQPTSGQVAGNSSLPEQQQQPLSRDLANGSSVTQQQQPTSRDMGGASNPVSSGQYASPPVQTSHEANGVSYPQASNQPSGTSFPPASNQPNGTSYPQASPEANDGPYSVQVPQQQPTHLSQPPTAQAPPDSYQQKSSEPLKVSPPQPTSYTQSPTVSPISSSAPQAPIYQQPAANDAFEQHTVTPSNKSRDVGPQQPQSANTDRYSQPEAPLFQSNGPASTANVVPLAKSVQPESDGSAGNKSSAPIAQSPDRLQPLNGSVYPQSGGSMESSVVAPISNNPDRYETPADNLTNQPNGNSYPQAQSTGVGNSSPTEQQQQRQPPFDQATINTQQYGFLAAHQNGAFEETPQTSVYPNEQQGSFQDDQANNRGVQPISVPSSDSSSAADINSNRPIAVTFLHNSL